MNTNCIQVQEIRQKSVWERFLLQQDLPPFLQSWNAGDQAEALGRDTLRLGLYQKDELIGVCLVERVHARRGKYLCISYGPVITRQRVHAFTALTEYLQQWGKKHGYHFIRMAPYWEKTDENMGLLSNQGYRVAPIHLLSEIVWKLDLDKSEDELMKDMRKTTRNLIRRAHKEDVVITASKDTTSVDTFLSLMEETHKRHGFYAYPDELYRTQVEKFAADDQVLVFTGKHGHKPVASAIVMYYGNVASYHHGASVRSKIPVAYLVQWEAIKEAKRRGCREYSFWGIVETEDKNHPFHGITKFKKGFGGDTRYLVPVHDKPLSWRYYVTYFIEVLRRIKRGFGLRRDA